MSKTVNTESKNTENSDHPTELQEISETFKRENEKIESLEKKVQKLSDEIFDIQKLYTEKKTSLFTKAFLIITLSALCFGGFWMYQQEDKMKAFQSVGNAIIEQKNVISEKITQASTNLSNAKIQEQIDSLKNNRKNLEQENTVLRNEISKLIEISDTERYEQEKSRKFMISQLEEKINFLKNRKNTAQPEISEEITETEEEQNTPENPEISGKETGEEKTSEEEEETETSEMNTEKSSLEKRDIL